MTVPAARIERARPEGPLALRERCLPFQHAGDGGRRRSRPPRPLQPRAVFETGPSPARFFFREVGPLVKIPRSSEESAVLETDSLARTHRFPSGPRTLSRSLSDGGRWRARTPGFYTTPDFKSGCRPLSGTFQNYPCTRCRRGSTPRF